MHATQLAELASWAAFNSHLIVHRSEALTADICNQYWSQSKCRQSRWMSALKLFELDVRNKDSNHDPWPAIEIVVQEIFLSEMLTRIWSASMVAHDIHYASDELTGLAHSVHIGHLEAKNRAMRLLLSDDTSNPEIFDRLNSLRRKVERWTDLLLSQLPDLVAAQRFGFQPNRVKDFAEENDNSTIRNAETRRVLYGASLREDLAKFSNKYSANPDINRKIASGLLACFPSDRFDSYGMPKSIQMVWLEKTTEETQTLLDNLTSLDGECMADPFSGDIVDR